MPRFTTEGEVMFQFAMGGESGVRIEEGDIIIDIEVTTRELDTFDEK